MDIRLNNKCQIDLGDIVEIHGKPYLIIMLNPSTVFTVGDQEYPQKRYYPQAFDGRGTYCEPRTLSELNAYIYDQDKKARVYPKEKFFLQLGVKDVHEDGKVQ
ncbi:gp21.7 [Bacillus phage SPO1]|uniref:Gp21.7 n=1 Tax=Bacillus phage SP01 TaxID=2884427 RepID=B6V2S6_BPSP1|nr:gp21.7 [Bacillus phage SPO1]ACI91018.1 gp21.7 [Bacillus phage SPO1]